MDNVILVLFPSVNPDRQIMEVEWYNKTKGTEYEGTYKIMFNALLGAAEAK